MMKREARCPKCGAWSEVAFDDRLPPGGFWWRGGSAGCPNCGAIVLVETEATGWRDVPDDMDLAFGPDMTCGNCGTDPCPFILDVSGDPSPAKCGEWTLDRRYCEVCGKPVATDSYRFCRACQEYIYSDAGGD